MKIGSSICVIVFGLILMNASCSNQICENCKVGAIDLSQDSKDYITYENGDTLVYKNDIGDELIFEVEVINEPYFICTKYLCKNRTGPFETIPCEYYDAMGIRQLLKQTNSTDPENVIFIDMSVSTSNYEEESTLFYDLFILNMSGLGALARGESIPFIHFSDPVLVPSETEIIEHFVAAQSLEVAGKTYENLLLTTESPNMVYYQIKEGIKVIKLDGSFYELMD